MEFGTALGLVRDALLMVLIVASPVLGIGLCVGLLIAILQAVSQLQEQTLTIVPKIFAMALAAMFFVPWIAGRMVEYASRLLGQPLF